MSKTLSVLEQEYIKATRPYSQKELRFMLNKIKRTYRLGNNKAFHYHCNHSYYVKENGRKEKEIISFNKQDSGRCSVCWKLSKTNKNIIDTAKEVINQYNFNNEREHKYLSYEMVDVEITFYKWMNEK
jgi:hypothetical protein